MTQPFNKTNESQQPEIDLNVLPGASTIHDANNAFAKAMTEVMLKQLGMCLHYISKPSELQGVANYIRESCCAIHFEAYSVYGAESDLPRYLRPELEQTIDPQAFTKKMATLEPPEPDYDCAIVRNLDWLTELFNLTPAEKKLLLWGYCSWNTEGQSLDCALAYIWPQNKDHAYQALAILLEEPVTAIQACFTTPLKLACLQLSANSSWHDEKLPLGWFIQGSECLSDLLEKDHGSKDECLSYYLSSRMYWHPPPLAEEAMAFGAWYKQSLAAAMRASALDQPLASRHIVSLLACFTGHAFHRRQFAPLAGRLEYLTILTAVKQAAVQCCTESRPLNEFAVLKALYSAAS